MTTEVQIALQPMAGQDPAAALTAVAAKLARQSLEMLVQQAGQPLSGKIVPPPPNLPAGMTQIAVADMVLTLKLSTPLPPGTPVRINVQQSPTGQPTVLVQPAAASSPAPNTPAPAMPSSPAPSGPMPSAQSTAQPPAAPQSQPAQQTGMVQTAVQAPLPPAAAVVTAPQTRSSGSAAQLAATAVPASVAPQAASPQPAPVQTTTTPAPAPAAVTVATAQPAASNAAPAQVATPPIAPASAPVASTPSPSPAPPVIAHRAPVPAALQPQPQPQAQPQPQRQPQPQFTVTTRQQPPAPVPAAPPAAAPATPSTPAPNTTSTVLAPVTPPAPAQPPAPQPQLLLQRLTQAFTQPAAPAPAAPPAPGTPAQMVLAATTQAAAQQQSAAPLLQTLATAMPQLPTPVAEAAARVLATRVNLDRGAPSGESLKSAVLKSGVFLDAPAKLNIRPDLRQALGQLRGTLLAWLGDDLAPVAPVSRRPAPPPPARGTAPRGQAPEMPQQLLGDAKEAGKALLSQTEGALARVKLMQLSTQPADAARPGAALASPAEWNLELPMMLGHELAMAQIQIARDGKARQDAKDKAWRLRFALKFSMLGEVGAQVSMVGRRTSVVIWADEDTTADALEAMLPELVPSLTAKGLDLISLSVRRGPPKDDAVPAGRLMDAVT